MNPYTDLFKKADASFDANFQEALSQLKGLSCEELSKIIPETDTIEVYQSLISIVEDAIQKNISQAELVNKIKQLGSTAQSIIKRIPAIAKLLI